jgi:Ca2+-binding EF-hand superfamily protein
MSANRRSFVTEWFTKFDLNGDKHLSLDEAKELIPKFESALKAKEITYDKIAEQFKLIDSNKDGKIDRQEFKSAIEDQISKILKLSHKTHINGANVPHI